MSVEHVNITATASLHKPRGFVEAGSKKVLRKNSGGTDVEWVDWNEDDVYGVMTVTNNVTATPCTLSTTWYPVLLGAATPWVNRGSKNISFTWNESTNRGRWKIDTAGDYIIQATGSIFGDGTANTQKLLQVNVSAGAAYTSANVITTSPPLLLYNTTAYATNADCACQFSHQWFATLAVNDLVGMMITPVETPAAAGSWYLRNCVFSIKLLEEA